MTPFTHGHVDAATTRSGMHSARLDAAALFAAKKFGAEGTNNQ